MPRKKGVCMPTLQSFLQSVFFFVKSLAVKVTKEMYRSSSILMAGMLIIAVAVFSAQGFGGSGKNALAAPAAEEESNEPPEEETSEGSILAEEARIQLGLLNTDSESQQLAGALLEENVRRQQRRQAQAKIETEALQKQILKEKPEAVYVEGDVFLTYPVVHQLRKKHIPVLTRVERDGEHYIVRIPSGS